MIVVALGEGERKENVIGDGAIDHFNLIYNTFIYLLIKDEHNIRKHFFIHNNGNTGIFIFVFFKNKYISIIIPHK